MLDIDYDARYDVLYIRFSDMRQSCGSDVDGVAVMRDFFTKEITGITVLDFMYRYERGNMPNIPLPVQFDYSKDVLPYIKQMKLQNC